LLIRRRTYSHGARQEEGLRSQEFRFRVQSGPGDHGALKFFKEGERNMKRQFRAAGVVAVLVGGMAAAARGAEPAAALTGFRAEFIAEVDSVGKKLTDLAGAMPQEKFAWRPAPGIRSVSEVYMHVAGGDFMLPSFMGVKVPAGIDRDMEKTVTDKAKVTEHSAPVLRLYW
jgi:hypothetical protein